MTLLLSWKGADFAECSPAECWTASWTMEYAFLLLAGSVREPATDFHICQDSGKAEYLEEKGRISVIRPLAPVVVDRMEKDTDKLRKLYQEGYDVALAMLPQLKGE